MKVQISYFRTQNGQEVDVVLEDRSGCMTAIEGKSSATLNADDFRGLWMLQEIAGKKFLRGVVLYTGRESLFF